MKIVVIANDAGGIVIFHKELLEELKKQNEVCVLIPYGDAVNDIRAMGCEVEIDRYLERRGLNPLKDMKQFRWYKKILKEQKPELVRTCLWKTTNIGNGKTRGNLL